MTIGATEKCLQISFYWGYSGCGVASTTLPPHLALRVHTWYRFTLTPSCVDSPCQAVQLDFTYSLQRISSPTNIRPIPPKTRRLQKCVVLQAGGGRRGSDIVVSFKTKVECAGNTEFRKYPSGASWDPSRLKELNTAARHTDRQTDGH